MSTMVIAKTTKTKTKEAAMQSSSSIDETARSQVETTSTASKAKSNNNKTPSRTKKATTKNSSKVVSAKKCHKTNEDDDHPDKKTTTKHTMMSEQAKELQAVWLPHLERCRDNTTMPSNSSTERVVSDLLYEFHQLVTKSTPLRQPNKNNNDSDDESKKAVTKTYHDAANHLLLQYLDCILSTTETDVTQVLLQVIVLVAVKIDIIQNLVTRAIEFARVLLDRVRCHAVTFLRIVASTILPLSKLSNKNTTTNNNNVNDILDTIVDTLTVACTDKSKLVRQAAVKASQPFFAGGTNNSEEDNGEEEDAAAEVELLESILWILQHDPIVTNRVTAVQVLPLTAQTCDYLVGRIRDQHSSVRVAVVHKLMSDNNASTSSSNVLDPELMATILQTGYTERCDETQQATVELVHKWISSQQQHNGNDEYNVLDILRKLNVLLYESQCELLVKIVLHLQSSKPNLQRALVQTLTSVWNNIISSSKTSTTSDNDSSKTTTMIDVEGVFLARVVCQQQNPQLLDQLLVDWDVTRLTVVLEQYIHMLRYQLLHENDEDNISNTGDVMMDLDQVAFVCQQLLIWSSTLASSEEGSTRHVRQVLSCYLSNPTTPDMLIATILQSLYSLQVTNNKNARRLDGTSSGLDETTELVVECIHKLHKQQQQNASSSSDEDDNANMMREYYQIRTLTIWNVLLEHIMADSMTTRGTTTLIQQALEPVLQSSLDSPTTTTPLVRQATVSCVGKLGLVWLMGGQSVHNNNDNDRWRQYQSQLIQLVLRDDNDEIRVQALLALADWALVSNKNNDSGNDDIVEALEQLILALLEDDDRFFVCVAAEVSTKLLLAHKQLSQSHQLLARLIQMSFDATISSEQGDNNNGGDFEIGSPIRIQQLLSLFFVSYASTSIGRQGFAKCLPSLLALTQKKTARMVSYVYDIVQQGHKADSTTNPSTGDNGIGVDVVSLDMAVELATFLVNRSPSGTFLRTVCKVLGGLTLLDGGSEIGEEAVAAISIPNDLLRRLSRLYQLIEELGMALVDDAALNSLGYLQETLVLLKADNDVEDEPLEADSVDSEGEDEDGNDDESSTKDVDTSSIETVVSEAPASVKPTSSEVKTKPKSNTVTKKNMSFSMSNFFGAIGKENANQDEASSYIPRRSADSQRESSAHGSRCSIKTNLTVSVLATLEDDQEASARRSSSSRVSSLSRNSQEDSGSTSTSRLTVSKPRRNKPSTASVLAMLDREASVTKVPSSRPSKSRIDHSSK